jgi:hypothetical protein
MHNDNERPPANGAQDATTAGAGYTTPNLGGRVPAGTEGVAEGYRQQTLSGANWFFWIAALSMINSIIQLASGGFGFLAGLGVTQLIDGVAAGVSEQVGGAATVIALLLDVMVAALFVGLGLFARKGQTWAFVLGMVLYALDGLIFLLVQSWPSFLFHLFVLYCLYRGLAGNNKLKALQAEAGAR